MEGMEDMITVDGEVIKPWNTVWGGTASADAGMGRPSRVGDGIFCPLPLHTAAYIK